MTNNFEELEGHFSSDEAFKPVEMFTLVEIAEVNIVPMPEEMMRPRNIPFESPEFQQQFPHGIACIEIAQKGIDVDFAFADDHLRRITVELVNWQGENIGKPKGANSHVHVLNEAFKEAFGTPFFGTANREALVGRKGRWGQHFGAATFGGQRRDWRWDVPREALPDDFDFQGDVRILQGQQATPAAQTQGVGGSAELSDEESLEIVINIVRNRPVDDATDINAEVRDYAGMSQKYVDLATTEDLLKELFNDDLIGQDGTVITITEEVTAEATADVGAD